MGYSIVPGRGMSNCWPTHQFSDGDQDNKMIQMRAALPIILEWMIYITQYWDPGSVWVSRRTSKDRFHRPLHRLFMHVFGSLAIA